VVIGPLESAEPAPGSTAPSPGASPAASSGQISFPLTVTDDEGTAVSIPARPTHVISFSPSNTEIAFALGAGDRLVGGTDADDYPAAAASLPDVATASGVLFEKVAALQPDLVLAAGNGFTAPAAITRLRSLGYPVLVLYAKSVAGVVSDIRLVGRALGVPDGGSAVADGLQSRLAAISSVVATLDARPSAFYEIGYGPDIFGPAPDSFLADLVSLGGGTPITTSDPNVFSIPLERLVADDPQVILLGDAPYGTCPSDVVKRAGWDAITAVKDGAIRPVNDIVVTRPGPRLDQGLASIARALHPGLSLPGEPADPPMCGVPAASPDASPVSSPAP